MFLLNLAAVPLLFLFGWIFARIIIYVSITNPFPNGFWGLFTSYSVVDWIALPNSIAIMLVFHEYVLVGISPLVVISILSIVFAAFLPSHLSSYLLFVATFNAAGALGDMIVVAWVLRQPDTTFIMDHGDKFLTFTPIEN
jgi:hypothetical protein